MNNLPTQASLTQLPPKAYTCLTAWLVNWAVSPITSECTEVVWLNASSTETDTELQLLPMCCFHYMADLDQVYY